jgi:hypothetical protein
MPFSTAVRVRVHDRILHAVLAETQRSHSESHPDERWAMAVTLCPLPPPDPASISSASSGRNVTRLMVRSSDGNNALLRRNMETILCRSVVARIVGKKE